MRRDHSWPSVVPVCQEKAAELLDLPFSPYRRYRDRGIEAIRDWLWDRDIDSTSRA